MSVIFIGDRSVGKTTLVYELASAQLGPSKWVKLLEPDLSVLKRLVDDKTGDTIATTKQGQRDLKIEAELPNGTKKTINVTWVDTPGELWESQRLGDSRQNEETIAKIIEKLESVEVILLILAPHESHIDGGRNYFKMANIEHDDPRHRFLPYPEWESQFRWWLEFLAKYVKNGQQIVICLNKVDLFYDCEQIVNDLPFTPRQLNVYKIQDYVRRKFFALVVSHIEHYNYNTSGNSLAFLVTSKNHRVLLEAPWVYLARIIN